MRLIFILILALVVSIALIVFPTIADQPLRLEAMGWVFETRQGAFVVALFVILTLFWLVRTLIGALFAGPGHLWQSLRMGSHARRERRLRDALQRWLNGDGELGARLLKRSRNVLPEWALEMLAIMGKQPQNQPAPDEEAEPLLTAMIARSVTSPAANPKPDLAVRKAHLNAWLKVAPNASLARSRMADVLEEEGSWPELVQQLEEHWKKGHQSGAGIKSRLIHAYLHLAETSPEQAETLLRKAYRLNPTDSDVLLAYGRSQLVDGDNRDTRRLWLNHLQHHDDMTIARELLDVLKQGDVMKTYRQLERKVSGEISYSLRWLRAELAHAAGLDGLAHEQMQRLVEEVYYAPAWQSMASWHAASGDYKAAVSDYSRALTVSALPVEVQSD